LDCSQATSFGDFRQGRSGPPQSGGGATHCGRLTARAHRGFCIRSVAIGTGSRPPPTRDPAKPKNAGWGFASRRIRGKRKIKSDYLTYSFTKRNVEIRYGY
jgi:hypothetical protein